MSFVNYKSKKGCRAQKTYEESVEAGVKKYMDSNHIFSSIPNDENRNNGCHVEASYLCHGIWEKIMKNEHPLSTAHDFIWKLNGDELVFHFDIMNNPCKYGKGIYSCGLFRICGEEKRKEVKNIYHSIGNMAPVPWFKLSGNSYINIQNLHKSVDERWDILLLVLKKNWKEWNKNCGLTFERYMILTCQQPYYEEVYNKVSEKEIDKISLDNINEWNKMITENSTIITFNPEKDENSDVSINKMINIIKIRCKMISILLSSETSI